MVASPGLAVASAEATEGASASSGADSGTKPDAGPKADRDAEGDDAGGEDAGGEEAGVDQDSDGDEDVDGDEDEDSDTDEADEPTDPESAGEETVDGDDTDPEPTPDPETATQTAALRSNDPSLVADEQTASTSVVIEPEAKTPDIDEPAAEAPSTLMVTTADVPAEEDTKSPWDFLPEYPEIAGVTKTEVAAVVFIAAAAATVVSIPTAPLLTIPLLLVTVAAWTRFEELGTNHHAPTAEVVGTVRALGLVTGTLIGDDEDGDPVNITLATGPANGNVEIIGSPLLGGFQYLYTANNPLTLGEIDDSFTITIDDKGGWRNHPLGMHTVTMTIDVKSGAVINSFPVFTQQATIVSVDPDTQQMQGTFAATDPDGTPLTFTGLAVSSLLGTTVQVSSDEDGNGTFTYTPSDAAIQAAALDILGIGDLITITATDANGGFAISTVTVHLVPPNSPPLVVPVGTAIPDIISGVATGSVLGTDPDGDDLHYSVTGYGGGQSAILGSGSMVVVDSDGKWTYIPSLDGGDPILGIIDDSFRIYVTDGRGGEASTLIGLITHELNIDYDNTVVSGGVTGGLSIPSAMSGLLTYSLGAGAPAGVTVNPDGTYAYTGTSQTSFSIVGTNTDGASLTVANVTVTPNQAPTLTTKGLNITLTPGKTEVWTGVTVNDPDGDSLTWTYSASNGSVSFSLPVDITDPISGSRTSSRTVTYKSNGGSDGSAWPIQLPSNGPSDTIYLTVTDSKGLSTTFTLSYPA
ncbi:hypothetical protein [Mycolicibacterium hippocampi]|uniref:Ig-like domain-containing protein n=1 Tax=Mycolicibacterium hippocampi TaxID=659824 RepID=UPI00351296E4